MRALSATMTLGVFLTIGVGGAAADSQCMQDAKSARAECKMTCDEDFTIARDLCRNIDPVCAAGCRIARDDCRSAVFAVLDRCVDECRTQLALDRAACPRRGPRRDGCLARAQVRAFVCRDDCREAVEVKKGLGTCRDDFRACMAGCVVTEPQPTAVPTEPPPPPASPTQLPTEAPVPTETPVPTRTATPRPTVTLTPIGPQ